MFTGELQSFMVKYCFGLTSSLRYDKTKIVTFKGTWVEIIINVGVVLFNLIKSIIVYLITLLVYKKLSTIIHHHTGD